MLETMTRRTFLKTSAVGIALSLIPLLRLALWSSEDLTETDWETLKKFIDNIIPATTVSVKASDAGVLNFMQKALESRYKDFKRQYKNMAVALEKTAGNRFKSSFHGLAAEQIILCMQDVENNYAELFQTLRTHTIEGYFSDPRHGGNKDYIAWKQIRLKSHILGIDFLAY